jgi:hypothetical protein
MRVVRTFVLAALMATTGWTSSRAAERVDLLLVLAADVSGSMDESKFDLQRSGYAAAFSDSRVIEAIRSGPNGRIAVAFIEWSGILQQKIVPRQAEATVPSVRVTRPTTARPDHSGSYPECLK